MKSNLFDRTMLPKFGLMLDLKIRTWQRDPEVTKRYASKRGFATREDFAQEVRVQAHSKTTHQTIGKYCSGKIMPTKNTFSAMCKVLGCNEIDLLPTE